MTKLDWDAANSAGRRRRAAKADGERRSRAVVAWWWTFATFASRCSRCDARVAAEEKVAYNAAEKRMVCAACAEARELRPALSRRFVALSRKKNGPSSG